jgi:hypothetical protein
LFQSFLFILIPLIPCSSLKLCPFQYYKTPYEIHCPMNFHNSPSNGRLELFIYFEPSPIIFFTCFELKGQQPKPFCCSHIYYLCLKVSKPYFALGF